MKPCRKFINVEKNRGYCFAEDCYKIINSGKSSVFHCLYTYKGLAL